MRLGTEPRRLRRSASARQGPRRVIAGLGQGGTDRARIDRLAREPFGPVLHLLRWRKGELDRVLEAIHATGYGLTFGIHSRIDETIEHVVARVRCGNIYVNRNMIGAVVGAQPFGGEGLSGTGFKAGGPHFLLRFLTERTISVNTAAAGGNFELLGKLGD